MIYVYRVRGPYATALAKIVLDSGHGLSDLSDKLAQRFSLHPRKEEPPHATIKVSDDDPNILVIVGVQEAVVNLLNTFVNKIPFISYEYNKYGPYTSIVVKIKGIEDGYCVAEFNDHTVIIHGYPRCIEGSKSIVHIVKPAMKPNRTTIVYPGIAIIKDTVVLLDDGMGKVMFSEHIRDLERKSMLRSLSANIARQGFSIRWRSSARAATLEKIAKDLEEAINDIEKLKLGSYDVGDVIVEGESIAFVNLTRVSKEYLDNIRNSVTPTMLGHHFMRTCGKLTELADLVDKMSKYIDRDLFYKSLKYALADSMLGKHVTIIHRKATNEKIEIGSIEVVDVVDDKHLGKIIVGKRVIKSEGVYDGLGVPKERGDMAFTLIPIDTWFIIHRYVRTSGEEKGIYININTPPEICSENRIISYLDVYVDLVYVNNRLEVIDKDELDKAIESKILSRDFIDATEKTINYVKENIEYLSSLARLITSRSAI
ncbi:MAG: DUF402 domain-containing protein [Ignisphaera sp.]